MKKLQLLVFTMILTLACFAQSTNNLYWAQRMMPKPGKSLEFEKTLVSYMKTHLPNFRYRVYTAITGPHTGAYYVIFGPVSYAALDTPLVYAKGKMAAFTDGMMLEGLCESFEIMHNKLDAELSMIQPSRKLSYLLVTEREYTSGNWNVVKDYWAKLKSARLKTNGKYDYAIFRPSYSGASNTFISIRYINNLAEIDNVEPLEDIFNAAHGKNAFYMEVQKINAVAHVINQEIRAYREDLSNNK